MSPALATDGTDGFVALLVLLLAAMLIAVIRAPGWDARPPEEADDATQPLTAVPPPSRPVPAHSRPVPAHSRPVPAPSRPVPVPFRPADADARAAAVIARAAAMLPARRRAQPGWRHDPARWRRGGARRRRGAARRRRGAARPRAVSGQACRWHATAAAGLRRPALGTGAQASRRPVRHQGVR